MGYLLIPVLVVSGLAATLVTVASNLLKGVSKTVVGTVMPKSSKNLREEREENLKNKYLFLNIKFNYIKFYNFI